MTKKRIRPANVILMPIGYLKVDYAYQREPDRKRIERIVAEWDDSKAREVFVSKRKDGCYIIDGQHTVAAGIEARGAQHQLHCRVFEGLTISEEAEMFYRQNDLRVRVGAADLFKARLAGNEPVATAINAIVTLAGLRVANYGAGGVITAVQALESIHVRHGTLTQTLSVLKAAWGDRGNRDGKQKASRRGDGAYNGMLMKAVGLFLARYPEADSARLIQKLKKEEPVDLLAVMKSDQKTNGGAHDLCGAKVLRGLYNQRLRDGKLPLNRVAD